jgi:hypothetical protein
MLLGASRVLWRFFRQKSEAVNHVAVTIQDVNFIVGHINKIADKLTEE